MQSRDVRVFCIFILVAIVLAGSCFLNIQNPYKLYNQGTDSSITSPTSPTTLLTCPPVESTPTREDFIRARLHESELIWKRGVETRHKTERDRPSSAANPWSGYSLTLVWDFFYPTFNCPHLIERIGQVGDGGKWVCGVSELANRAKNCVVYSYGVAGDTSFEEDILSRTSCTLRAFDHTISGNVALTKKYPTRSTFDRIGLGSSDTGNVRTLKTEMNRHGDEFIDILKVDVEGGEFELFRQILKDFPNGFPFGQLLIEIHLNALGSEGELFAKLKSWWEALENAGLRAFNREPNLFILYMGMKNPSCFEYSFLNVKVDHTILHG